MTTKPRPQDFETGFAFWQARRAWVRSHGGSLLGTAAIAVLVGVASGSAAVLVVLVGVAIVGTAYARSRP